MESPEKVAAGRHATKDSVHVDRLDRLRADGNAAFKAGNLQAAKRHYTAAISLAESMPDDPAPTAMGEAAWRHFHSDLDARAEPVKPGNRGKDPASGDGGNCTASQSFGKGCRVCTHGCRAAWLCLLRRGVSSSSYGAWQNSGFGLGVSSKILCSGEAGQRTNTINTTTKNIFSEIHTCVKEGCASLIAVQISRSPRGLE